MFSYAAYDMHQFQDLGNWYHFEIPNYSFIVQYMSHIIFNIILSILIAFYRFFKKLFESLELRVLFLELKGLF